MAPLAPIRGSFPAYLASFAASDEGEDIIDIKNQGLPNTHTLPTLTLFLPLQVHGSWLGFCRALIGSRIPRGVGFSTDGMNSLVKKRKRGRASQTEHATRQALKSFGTVSFFTWDCVLSGTFVSFVEVSFVDFPNWLKYGRSHMVEGVVGSVLTYWADMSQTS